MRLAERKNDYSGDKEIANILNSYKHFLKNDFSSYCHHCQRLYQYSLTLLLMKENRKLAICAAFHDLDIWVSRDMDYLSNSSEMAIDYCKKNQLNFLFDEINFVISNHHKIKKIKGNIEAEAFRKADLIDLSAGFVKYHLPKSIGQELEEKYPRLKFSRIISVKILKYALRNPQKPLPMIKW
ncbi:MAG: hypothetical protein ACJA0X_001242 [Cyclobacteriaceae bacterium]|jgi:hypothetical protein